MLIHKKIRTNDEYDNYYKYYQKYQKELQKLQGENWDIVSLDQIKHNEKNFDNKATYMVYEETNNKSEFIGFITYQNVYWEGVIYIEDVYVLPHARRHKYASSMVKQATMLSSKDTIVFFYILKNNKRALSFWSDVAKENKWVRTYDPKCRINVSEEDLKNTTQYQYRLG